MAKKSVKKSATIGKESTAETGARVKVTLVLFDLGAKRVSLSGDFNDWSPDGMPMKKGVAGQWERTIELAPGRYEYKFVVDGNWAPDPLARESVWNQHGTLNSILEVRA